MDPKKKLTIGRVFHENFNYLVEGHSVKFHKIKIKKFSLTN